MPIEHFTLDDFRDFLQTYVPANDVEERVRKGEIEFLLYVYHSPTRHKTNKRIVIRTSINPYTERVHDKGQDSIRCWIEYSFDCRTTGKTIWKTLGKDAVLRTHRTKNWRSNLTKRLRNMWRMALEDELERNKTFRKTFERYKKDRSRS